MKTKISQKKQFLKKTMVYFGAFLCSLLLISCGGTNANMDMLMSMANGNIQKEQVISSEELHKILTEHFGPVRIKLSDSQYSLPDNGKVAQLEDFIHCSPYASQADKPANWDCDDYAIAAMVPLRNYAFGAMYVTTTEGKHHVMNVFVNYKKEVVYWEPQTCQYSDEQFYAPELIIF